MNVSSLQYFGVHPCGCLLDAAENIWYGDRALIHIVMRGVAVMCSKQLLNDDHRGIKTSLIRLNNTPNDKPLKSS